MGDSLAIEQSCFVVRRCNNAAIGCRLFRNVGSGLKLIDTENGL